MKFVSSDDLRIILTVSRETFESVTIVTERRHTADHVSIAVTHNCEGAAGFHLLTYRKES